MSRLDQLYRRILLTKFFTKGWGKPDNIKRIFEFRKIISDRETCRHLVPSDYPVHIDKDEIYGDHRVLEGHFVSPFTKYLPGIMPKEVEKANFQMLLPKTWNKKLKPVCLQLAGTGDHFFWRRRNLMARPLLKDAGIASIILENPYYGERKPKNQMRSSLHNVSDLFVMGGALVLESLVLFHWCQREGWGPLGITGISMGGHMASLAATNWHEPVVLVPCLSWSTASCVFTEGVMSGAIPWEVLQSQYVEDSIYEEEIRKLIHSPEQDRKLAYAIGQKFAKEYPQSIENLQQVQCEQELHNSLSEKSEGSDASTVMPTNTDSHSTETVQYYNKPYQENQSDLGGVAEGSHNKKDSGFVESLSKGGGGTQYRFYTTKPVNVSSKLSSTLRGTKPPRRTLHHEVLEFMRGVMDECTHLGNFSTPLDTDLIIIVAAKKDAYIPREGVLSLEQLWPGAEVRYIDSGHISAFLFNQDIFRKAIMDAFDKQIQKYYS